MPTTEQVLLDRVLPKWPQMLVTGHPVTVKQAKEIIRRTDTFFVYSGGNDKEYCNRVRDVLGLPPDCWSSMLVDTETRIRIEERWREDWKYISTNYVHNSWISTSFIGGPHGWVHPDGAIGYVDNVGKWPSVKEILDDWRTLARAFSFLRIGVTLMSGESCDEERRPVVNMVIRRGAVNLTDPAGENVHHDHPPACRRAGRTAGLDEMCESLALGGFAREHGLPWEWIEEWSARKR